MLQEFLRRDRKWADKPDSDFREGSNAELGICSWPVWFQPTLENLPKGRHGSGGFFVGFLRFVVTTKKSARKSASQKQKIRRRPTPPKSTSQAQNSSAKPTKKSVCQPPSQTGCFKCAPGFFDCEEGLLLKASSGHRFWDTLWRPSGHGRDSHAEMHLQSLCCCWWEGHALLRTLPDNTFSQKHSFCAKNPKIT